MAVLFDTLKMVETLQAGGFTDQQARAMTTALGDAADVAQVATRGDVMDLGIGMKHDLAAFKGEMEGAFAAHQTAINNRLDVLLKDMTIRLGGLVVGCGAVVSLLAHFWHG